MNKEKRMTRCIRSDCTAGSFEKKNGLIAGTFRHKNERDMRSDKTFNVFRSEKNSKRK